MKLLLSDAAPIQAQYQIFFMKKLWINTIPGKDPNADYIFHFPQELPKYLRGYHKCTKQDAVKLAALILRAKYMKENALIGLSSVLKDLIPVDLVKAQGSSDWKKSITAAYNIDGDMTSDEAKIKFLTILYQWPTFGSTFFEVKQNSERTYPEIIIIAINKKGVNIIHPQTKVSLILKKQLTQNFNFNFLGHVGHARFLRAQQLVIWKYLFPPHDRKHNEKNEIPLRNTTRL